MTSSCLEIRGKKEPQWKLFLKILSFERRNTLHSRYRGCTFGKMYCRASRCAAFLHKLWHLQPAPAEKQMIWGDIQATFTGRGNPTLSFRYLQSCLCAIPTAQTLYSWSTIVARFSHHVNIPGSRMAEEMKHTCYRSSKAFRNCLQHFPPTFYWSYFIIWPPSVKRFILLTYSFSDPYLI